MGKNGKETANTQLYWIWFLVIDIRYFIVFESNCITCSIYDYNAGRDVVLSNEFLCSYIRFPIVFEGSSSNVYSIKDHQRVSVLFASHTSCK